MKPAIPVVLFAYSRPDHLTRTLESLRSNEVPLIYAFSDGPKTPKQAGDVAKVREILRNVDWCAIDLCLREENLGLGRSVLTGVSAVLKKHDSAIVFEDDLICVPGTYAYLTAALEHYESEPVVMSVTGWTHPLVTPKNVVDQPYFDGHGESWVWGTWKRAWKGMEKDAKTLMGECRDKGIDVYRYGDALAAMAEEETKRNIWAIRFIYLQILKEGLCLRPPHSMVEHTGFDEMATNASDGTIWSNPPLKACPPIPERWPPPIEHPECRPLWRSAWAMPKPSVPKRILRKILRMLR